MKHAHATAVAIKLRCEMSSVVLQVIDNGQGFNPVSARSGGLGLIGMRERAEQAGGAVELVSTPGGGTTVTARLPLISQVLT